MGKVLGVLGSGYEVVVKNSTNEAIGSGGGAKGDYLSHLIIDPDTVTPGNVVLKDGSTTLLTFAFGTLDNTAPFTLPVGLRSKNGAWTITTGDNVNMIAAGTFS